VVCVKEYKQLLEKTNVLQATCEEQSYRKQLQAINKTELQKQKETMTQAIEQLQDHWEDIHSKATQMLDVVTATIQSE